MNIKKIIASVLACCLVGGIMPSVSMPADNTSVTASAADYTEGTYENLTYKNYGTYIEISGCDKSATEVIIPSKIDGLPVTSIGNDAFKSCTSLISIKIPDSVKSIGKDAFYGTPWREEKKKENPFVIVNNILIDGTTCSGDVIIPDSVTRIEDYAFFNCESLTSIEIPDSVTSIGDSAFCFCKSLTSIEIPDSVKSIGECAFSYCKSLTSIEIPDSVTSIGDSAFYFCESLTSIEIPDSVKSIGEWAFSYCTSLISIEIPDSVTSIESYTFSNCESLKSITILNSDCKISDSKGTIAGTATIYGYDNSTAQDYAEKYNRNFVSLGKAPEKQPTTSGQIEVTIVGDANEDGFVNIADATNIVQYIANPDKYSLSEQGYKNADCYNPGDGVTGLDALAIQKLETGVIDSLPLIE